jgi:hypothetical protein
MIVISVRGKRGAKSHGNDAPPLGAPCRRFVSIAIQVEHALVLSGGHYSQPSSLAAPALSPVSSSFSSSHMALRIEKETAKLTPSAQEKYHLERLVSAQ